MSFVALGEIVEIKGGGTPDKAVADYWNGEIPWASVKDFKSTSLDRTTDFITPAGVKNSATNIIPSGTIIVPTRMAVGKAAISTIDLAINQDLKALFPKKEADTRYLLHALLACGDQLERHATGATVKGITLDVLRSLKIPLPRLPEQRRIAGILDQADTLSRKRVEALTRLNALGRAIFYDMFGDPVTNSKSLPTIKLSELGTLDRGVSKHRPRNEPSLLGGPHPLIQTGDVSRADDYINEYTSTYSDIGLKQSRMWPKGTLCITIAANIADTAILNFDACFPDSVVGFKGQSDAINFFVHSWFVLIKGEIERVAPAVAQKNINLAILRELDIIKPLEGDIKEYYNRMRMLKKNSEFMRTEIARLRCLFTSLQHRAFRGEDSDA